MAIIEQYVTYAFLTESMFYTYRYHATVSSRSFQIFYNNNIVVNFRHLLYSDLGIYCTSSLNSLKCYLTHPPIPLGLLYRSKRSTQLDD